MGWKIINDFPKLKKYVIIAEPHTSWRDFPIAILAKFCKGLKVNYVGKTELFKPPFGWFFRMLGGAPIERDGKLNKVQEIVSIFNKKDYFVLGMSPKGDRSLTANWKTGFYYIAKGANIPVVMATLDFKNKQVKISEPFYPTDDKDKDFEHFYSFYKGIVGYHPKEERIGE